MYVSILIYFSVKKILTFSRSIDVKERGEQKVESISKSSQLHSEKSSQMCPLLQPQICLNHIFLPYFNHPCLYGYQIHPVPYLHFSEYCLPSCIDLETKCKTCKHKFHN